MIYMRGQAARLRPLAPARQCRLGLGRRAALFQASPRTTIAATTDLHGAGGEWRVEQQRLRWDILDAFREARRGDRHPAHATISTTATTRAPATSRSTSGAASAGPRRKAFLRPALQRPNLRVRDRRAWSSGLVLDGTARDAASRYRADGEAAQRRAATGEVILAAGAINSPQLLELSGIGAPARARARTASPSRHALPGRRREPAGPSADPHRLQGHGRAHAQPASPTACVGKARMAARICLCRARADDDGAVAARHLRAQRSPDRATPNLEYHVQPLSPRPSSATRCTAFPAFTAVCNLRPESRGSVRIRSADPAAQPAIRPNYLAHRRATGTSRVGVVRADPPHRRAAARLRRTRRRSSCPARRRRATPIWRTPPATSAPPSSIRSAPAGWAATTDAPWSTRACACAASPACASSTPRSCRRSPRATPTRRP